MFVAASLSLSLSLRSHPSYPSYLASFPPIPHTLSWCYFVDHTFSMFYEISGT